MEGPAGPAGKESSQGLARFPPSTRGSKHIPRLRRRSPARATPPAAGASGPVAWCIIEGGAQGGHVTHPGSERYAVAKTLCRAASCPRAQR